MLTPGSLSVHIGLPVCEPRFVWPFCRARVGVLMKNIMLVLKLKNNDYRGLSNLLR